MSSRPILFAGGGTGGHLYPGIAVAQALTAIRPDVVPVFLCTQRDIDRTILKPTEYEFIPQPIVPPAKSMGGLLKFWKSWRETKDLVKTLMRERRPAAVLGLGGYAAGVAVKRAGQKGIPTAILNPDAVPGRANQFLMRSAKLVFCQFDASADYVSQSNRPKLRTTGCPIRAEFSTMPTKAAAALRLGLDPARPTLVVTGASQGARTVNDAVLESLKSLPIGEWQILHLSGKDHADAVRAAYASINVPAAVVDFTPAMADVWAVADLAVARSGASTVAEVTACGVPAIFLPYPFHKDKHQRVNAKLVADVGGAVLLDDLRDGEQNAEQLRPVLQSLMSDPSKRQAMAAAAMSLGKPDAATRVAKLLAELIN